LKEPDADVFVWFGEESDACSSEWELFYNKVLLILHC